MNFLKRLFKREILGKELDSLISAIEGSKDYVKALYSLKKPGPEYRQAPIGRLDVKNEKGGVFFDLSIENCYFVPLQKNSFLKKSEYKIKKIFSYQEIEKNPVLKKYVKKRNLESSLSIISIALFLASVFFISNNITGNAILTATPNSSGVLGAGLFVLGAVSFILARNI